MSLQKLFFSLLRLLLIGIGMAAALSAQPYRFEVMDADTGEPLSLVTQGSVRGDYGLPLIQAGGESFNIRVRVLDQYNQPYENYAQLDRDVTVILKGKFGEWNGPSSLTPTAVVIPASEFENGVAAEIEFPAPVYAGTNNMRMWATDGNITTDNASRVVELDEETGLVGDEISGFFTVIPAGFRVTYAGTDQDLSSHDITTGAPLRVRVRALNADNSTATGFTMGEFFLSSGAMAGPQAIGITYGGLTDNVLLTLDQPSLELNDDDQDSEPYVRIEEPYTISVADTLSGTFDFPDASGEFDVVEADFDPRPELDEIAFLSGSRPFPGAMQSLRFQINNNEDEGVVIRGPVDTLFELVDSRNNEVMQRWVERWLTVGETESPNPAFDPEIHDPNNPEDPPETLTTIEPIPIPEDGVTMVTSFVLPLNMTAGNYFVRIRPGYSAENEETIEREVSVVPDLAIRQLEHTPGEYRGGDAVAFQLSFLNLPNDELGGSGLPTSAVPGNQRYRLQIHLSPNPHYGDEDDFLVWQRSFWGIGSNGRLLPEQQVDIADSFMLPDDFDGTYYVMARINAAGGPNGTGFGAETVADAWGNNSTASAESQKLTILPRQSTDTSRVSLTNNGGPSQGLSDNPVVSLDGRYVAFESFDALAGQATSGFRNIFLRNIEGSDTVQVSVATTGAPNGHSGHPSLTADGRFVAFQSAASNLVAGDTNGYADIFVRDLHHDITRRLTLNRENGEQANDGSQLARISADGRFVAFESTATNLLPAGDPAANSLSPGVSQIYLYDRDVGGTGVFDSAGNTSITLISQAGGKAAWKTDPGTGLELPEAATNPRFSSDGNYVVFTTRATNILEADGNFSGSTSTPFPQVVRWNRQTHAFTVVSVEEGSSVLADNISGYPAVNKDGEYVAFASRAQNMTDDDYDQSIPHLFRARIQNGVVTEMLRMNAARTAKDRREGRRGDEPNNPIANSNIPDLGAYEPTLSDDGHLLAFASESSNLLPAIPVRNVDRTTFHSPDVFNFRDDNSAADVYLYDLANPNDPHVRRASVSRFGYGATPFTVGAGTVTSQIPASRRPALSPDGRFVAFTSDAKGHNGLIFGDTNYEYLANNAVRDIYLFDLKRGITTPDDLPDVELLMPASLNVIAGTSVRLSAKATVAIGSLDSVEFYVNDNLMGTVQAAAMDAWGQFILNWQVPEFPGNFSLKQYDVVAVAVDSNGIRSEVSNLSRVTAAPYGASAPTVSIISPEDGFSLTNRSILALAAIATAEEQEVDRLEFFIRNAGDGGLGISMGDARRQSNEEDVFRFDFDLNGLSSHFSPHSRLPAGAYEVTAVARDETGNAGQSAPVGITVSSGTSDRPELVNLTANKSLVAVRESIRFSVEVADPVPPMAGVSLYANGAFLAEMTADTDGVQLDKFWSWQGAFNVPGVWDVYAVAIDADGNQSVSESVQVTVARALLRLDATSNRVNIGDSVGFELEVLSGSPTIGYVDFFVGGSAIARDSNPPYLTNWTPQTTGSYTISAIAWDTETAEFLTAPSLTVEVVEPLPAPVLAWGVQDSGTSANLNGIIYFNGQFISVGTGGILLASPGNGVWTHGSSGTGQTLRAVADGDGRLVAVGDGGVILTSDDGFSWSPRSSGTTRRLLAVAHGAGRFVVVGEAGVMRVSDDAGATWQSRSSTASDDLLGIAYGSDGFVAVGANGRVIQSSDGSTWTQQDAGTSAALHAIAVGQGNYVAVGGRWDSSVGSYRSRILTSPNGVDWTLRGSEILSRLHGIHFDAGAWLATGTDGAVVVSADAFTWALQEPATSVTLLDAAHGGDMFVVVGQDGTILTSSAGTFQTWTSLKYTAEELGDPAISGPSADPDGTGISNLMRYALGIGGDADDRESLPQVLAISGGDQSEGATSQSSSDDTYLALSYKRSKAQEDVVYLIEASSDLTDWEPIDEIGGLVSVEANGESETVTARDGVSISAAGDRRFLRLRLKLIE